MGIRLKSTWALWILSILIISFAPIGTTNADEGIGLDLEIDTTDGIAWISMICQNVNGDCPSVEVSIIWPNGDSDTLTPTSNEVVRNVTSGNISILSNQSFQSSQWELKMVIPDSVSHEITDHPEHSGHQDVVQASVSNINTGILGESDTDVIHISGNEGDILHLYQITSRFPFTLDILDTSGQIPVLIETLGNNPKFVEIPTDDGVYLKIHSNDGEGVNPYSFIIDIWSDADENPYVIYPETRINGTIGPLDSEGDFYLLKVGPGSPLEIEFETTDLIELRYVENGNMTELNQSSGILRIENVGETNATLLIHIRSSNPVFYSIIHSIDSPSDGNSFGDAPDTLTNLQQNKDAYPDIQDDGSWYNGHLNDTNDIDYWIFEIDDINGSIVRIIPSSESTDCCIMRIITLSNITDSASTLNIIGQGTHAIQISLDENRTSDSIPISYSLRLELQDVDEPIYFDRSSEFIGFYVVIGLLMLSPLLPIAYWQWKDRDMIRVEKHERLRLIRLRERLSGIGLDSQDDDDIDAALSSLGDSEWDALIHEWGRPDVRHSTENLDIAAWRLDMKKPTLLIGLRSSVTWEHAGVRLAATMGDRVEIEEVHPSHLHFEDEIVLDKMQANKLKFIRVKHSQGSTKLDVVVTGTVGGTPMAAMPSKALGDSEE